MKKHEIRKKLRTAIIISLIIYCVCFKAAGYDMSYYMNPAAFVMTPHKIPNTKWTCQTRELYFISDKHGECYGEAVIDGEHFFIGVMVDGSGVTHIRQVDATTLKGIGKIKSGPTAMADLVFCGRSKYAPYSFYTVSSEAEDCMLSPAGESLTLHFVREDLDKEIDFWGPGCSFCRDVRLGLYPYPSRTDEAKAVRLRWEQSLLEMLGPDAPGAA